MQKQNSDVKKLNAKKIDGNLAMGDDFFDSFEPAPVKPVKQDKPKAYSPGEKSSQEKKNKLAAMDPFGFSDKNTCDDDTQDRLKQFEGKKAISSADFFRNEQDDAQDRERFNKFQGAKAISSDAFFGNGEEVESGRSSNNLEDYKDAFSSAATKAAEHASKLKEKAMDFFGNLKESYQNS